MNRSVAPARRSSSNRSVWLVLPMAAACVCVVAINFFHRPTPTSFDPTIIDASQPVEIAGICPWRNPNSDLKAYFPTANHYERRLLNMSDLRPDVLAELGPKTPMDSNGLYYYRVYRDSNWVGSVIVQRTAGEYGVVEYTAGVGQDGKIKGVRIQRLREPDLTVKTIEAPSWLASFSNKSTDGSFIVGKDIPPVPESAHQTAQSLADSVRRLIVEYDIAHARGR